MVMNTLNTREDENRLYTIIYFNRWAKGILRYE